MAGQRCSTSELSETGVAEAEESTGREEEEERAESGAIELREDEEVEIVVVVAAVVIVEGENKGEPVFEEKERDIFRRGVLEAEEEGGEKDAVGEE